MSIITEKRRKTNSCFGYNERLLLEGYLSGRRGFEKITKRKRLAEIFGCDRKTIYNEIKRGLVEHLRSDLSIVTEYNADFAQKKADYENTARGRDLKIGKDTRLCEILKSKIKKEKQSPYAVIAEFNIKGWRTETRFCEKTLYNWINKGVIPDIANTDLPNKGIKYKEKGSKRRHSRAECARRSIDYRPEEAEDRRRFGHWEADTVKGGKGTPPDCLFTMTERKTRNEKAVKIPNAKAESAVAYLDRLEREMGSEAFRKTFKTITCDGGSEFMDVKGMETSCIDGKPRTKVFFAHPYTACERGTNENHNRMLRRFFPKGCDFSKVTDKEVEEAVDWMNNYPRKIHNGLTPLMLYDKCCNF